jgi:PAS domain S-box-containing protein
VEKAPTRPPKGLLHELQLHQVELEMQNEALRQSQIALEALRDRYVELYTLAPVGYLTLNDAGLIADLNLAGIALLGGTGSELLHKPFPRFITPESADLWHIHLRNVRQQDAAQSCELTLLHSDGTRVVAQVDSRRQIKEGAPDAVLVTLTDITNRKQSEARLQAIFDASPDPLLITDAKGSIVSANRHIEEMLGYALDELLGQPVEMLLPAHCRAGHPAQRECFAAGPDARRMGRGLSVFVRRKDGSECAVEISLSRIETDQGLLFASALRDITERLGNEEKINKLAYFDTLTGLPNRSLVPERLKQAMAASQDSDIHGALLFIDLDDFKTLNDTLGHLIGDQLLKQVAQRLTACAGEGDTVATNS